MNAKEFIEIYLMDGIGAIQGTGRHDHYYLSFGLITQGIEFLGACLDNGDYLLQGRSRARFEKAITELFPRDYHKYVGKGCAYDLYANLRCGLLHVVLPGHDVELIQQAEVSAFGGDNLDIVEVRGKKRLILVAQAFYNDFKDACEEVRKRIGNKEISDKKVYNPTLETEP